MKTIGLLGGMSWESTASYYRILNEGIKKALGGLHSAKVILVSVDFHPFEALQKEGNWAETAKILKEAAANIEKAGADFILICTNTMHLVAAEIEAEISIPLLHIADATAQEIVSSDIKRIGLLGTAFTMEKDFYKGRLQNKYNLEVITPNTPDRKIIHDIIYKELCLGQINDTSRSEYIRIIDDLVAQGAEGIILGCTEIALLVSPKDTNAKLFDTTLIHAQKAIQMALE